MTDIAARATPGSRSLIALIVEQLVAVCAVVPYALVGLGLRLVMARVFFLSGQAKIDGLTLRITIRDVDFWVVLPTQIKSSTFQMFETQYAHLPIPPTITAYLFTYAEFVLPICLVLGFATRFSALALLAMSVLMAIYATPATFWTTQVYWISILMVLLSVGPGAISFDALIRYLYERDKAPDYR